MSATAPKRERAEVDVLVVGAGPSGLMLASWLQRLGATTLVVDPKPGPTRESRAVIVQARSLEIYDQMGLGAEVARRGQRVTSATIWRPGGRVGRIALGALGAGLTPHPYMFALEQSENEEMLVEDLRARGNEVAWETTLEDFDEETVGVLARLRTSAGAAREVRASFLCAADGARSGVREKLAIPFEGATRDDVFYVADVVAEGEIDEGSLNFKLVEETFLVAFPLRGHRRFRLIGILPRGLAVREDLRFDDLREELATIMGVEVTEVRWFSRYKVSHRVAARFRRGRCFLLGDAAHVHSPVGGQGMNTGLLDAHNLAWKLAAVVRGQAESSLLDTYEIERRPFAQLLVRTTDRMFSVVSSRNKVVSTLRGRLMPTLLERLLGATATPAGAAGRAAFVPATMFRLVSQTQVSYRTSPLSRGEAGAVAGGDRLPWVPGEGGSNFDALVDARPQLHLVGGPDPGAAAWAEARGFVLEVLPWSAAAADAGLLPGSALLVRPDGWIGVAMPRFAADVADYALRDGWSWRSGT